MRWRSPKGVAIGLGVLALLLDRKALGTTTPQRVVPHSPEALALFREAAAAQGLTGSEWYRGDIQEILRSESGGYAGIPNYTFGETRDHPEWLAGVQRPANSAIWPSIWAALRRAVPCCGRRPKTCCPAVSTATGLGQLTLDNTLKYYPRGADDIGNLSGEAYGMIAYIRARYGTPARALAFGRARGAEKSPPRRWGGY